MAGFGAPGPPAPDPRWCRRAWELGSMYPFHHVAEILRNEYPEIDERFPGGLSYETARQWAKKGRYADELRELIDEVQSRERGAERINQFFAEVLLFVRDPKNDATILDVLPHLRWLHREAVELGGGYPARKSAITVNPQQPDAVPDPDTAAAVGAAEAEADEAERRLLEGGES